MTTPRKIKNIRRKNGAKAKQGNDEQSDQPAAVRNLRSAFDVHQLTPSAMQPISFAGMGGGAVQSEESTRYAFSSGLEFGTENPFEVPVAAQVRNEKLPYAIYTC